MALLAAASSQAHAADFGIGVSVQSDDSWIYVPIDITPNFRLEPSLRYRKGESESSVVDTSYWLPYTTSSTLESSSYELALGAFGLKNIGESVRVYYGARVAYIENESEIQTRVSFGGEDFESLQEEKSSQDGYRISPTLGFEYLLNKHFSIGAEAEWFYQDVDSKYAQQDYGNSNGSSESTGTDTRLIVRFMF